MRLIGSIDRVDRLGDGRLRVIDYKSGSNSSYAKLSHDDPLLAGQMLQLPIYSRAARTIVDPVTDAPVDAWYWFVLRAPRKPRGYTVDGEVEQALNDALGVIVSGIDSGYFPLRPREPGFQLFTECEYCDPDELGTVDTHRGGCGSAPRLSWASTSS